MLVSDKYGFIIATPTKCGTTSLQGLVTQWNRLGGDERVLRMLRGESETKHRMAPGEGLEGYDRWFVSRYWKTRLPSMYEWLRRKPVDEEIGRSILRAEEAGGREAGWLRFLTILRDTRLQPGYFDGGKRKFGARRPYMWTDTLEELSEYLAGVDADGTFLPWYREDGYTRMLNVESLQEDWCHLLDSYDVDEDSLYDDLDVKQLNSTRAEARLFDTPAAYWDVSGASLLVVEAQEAGK